jgi:hypothetical protein
MSKSALAILAALILGSCAADTEQGPAKTLDGPGLKNLIVGNTMRMDAPRGGYIWSYIPDSKNMLSKASFGNFRGKWSVTPQGKWCITILGGPAAGTRCRVNVRASGDILRGDGVDGASDIAAKIYQGNPKNL